MSEKDPLPMEYTVTTDPARIDIGAVHAYLARSYWAEEIPRAVVERSIAGSLCASLFHGAAQVGFARAVTDRATFAYLADVYVLEEHRGRGLARRLVEELRAHPDLDGIRRWMLVTRDAHGLYEKLGFTSPAHPERFMEAVRRDCYKRRP
jgi:GNAT superfamily N-acetyltransferase